MYLSHVAVQGFRNLGTFSLELAPGLNVLVGENNIGKTNLEEQRIAYVAASRARNTFVLCVHRESYNALRERRPDFLSLFEVHGVEAESGGSGRTPVPTVVTSQPPEGDAPWIAIPLRGSYNCRENQLGIVEIGKSLGFFIEPTTYWAPFTTLHTAARKPPIVSMCSMIGGREEAAIE